MSERTEREAEAGIIRQAWADPEAEGPVIDLDDPAQAGTGHWLRPGGPTCAIWRATR